MGASHKTSDDHTDAAAIRRRVTIRPLQPGDAAGVAALFDRLSAESRRRRFLTSKERLSAGELRRLTDVDHVRHEALAAIDHGDARSIVGIARYAEFPGRPGVADVAAEVADDRQGMGIGMLLGRRLLERARANGVEVLEATTGWENRSARALARGLGFRARASCGTEIELELVLSPPRESERIADGRVSDTRRPPPR